MSRSKALARGARSQLAIAPLAEPQLAARPPAGAFWASGCGADVPPHGGKQYEENHERDSKRVPVLAGRHPLANATRTR